MTQNIDYDQAAVRRLAVVQRLTLEALGTGSVKELSFLVLNQTALAAPYDRAYLWEVGKGVRLLGVSGEAVADPRNEACEKRRLALAALTDLSVAGPLPQDFAGGAAEGGFFWLPLPVNGRPYAGLLLERFGPPDWTGEEANALRVLADAYSGAFKPYAAPSGDRISRGVFRKLLFFVILAALAAALAFVRLPLRIVAPCEIAAANPIPANAPVDGVIKDVLVRPGVSVRKGDILYTYDTAVAREELDVAAREVEIARSNLERASARAGTERSSRADARVLQNRLAQDAARLEALRERFEKYTVLSPADAVVISGEPHELVGRPVRVGEAVVTLADAADTLVRIWLPQEDAIEFDPTLPVRVFLHSDPGKSRPAALGYVAAHATEGMDGIYGFMAEARWTGDGSGIRLGQKGTAVLYGEKVRLGYWLARKPLAVFRRIAGV